MGEKKKGRRAQREADRRREMLIPSSVVPWTRETYAAAKQYVVDLALGQKPR